MIGDIEIKREKINISVAKKLKKRFIALDTETTGLDWTRNSIIEIGLSLFEDGVETKNYGTLINVGETLSNEIVELTGITNEMLRSAPNEENVYKEVIEFLGDALSGETLVVAHNAQFDMEFIERALKRYGVIGTIRYVDTLNTSRSLIKGLFNYKQDTVATYFNIVNEAAHRALTDAQTCGKIMVNLVNVYETNDQMLEIKTPLDDLFELKVRERGLIYYRSNVIKYFEKVNDGCTAIISGSDNYEVTIKEENDTINATCGCPYYTGEKKLCKHIYATYLKYLSRK